MNLRIFASITIISIWATAGFVVIRGSDDVSVYEIPASSAPLWEREKSYLQGENTLRIKFGPENITQTRYNNQNPNRIKVLVVGDSATFGHGVGDLDNRWWERLAVYLDSKTQSGAFDIIALGQNGASLFRYADWLTQERLEQINPDVVLFAINGNDVVPTGDEFAVCPKGNCAPIPYLETRESFVKCMSVSSSIPKADIPALYFRCVRDAKELYGAELVSQTDVIGNVDKRFESAFTSTLANLKLNLGSISVGIIPMLNLHTDVDSYGYLIKRFSSTGWAVSKQSNILQTFLLYPNPEEPDLIAHPLDLHPGPVATAALAADAGDLVLSLISKDRLNQARQTAQFIKRPIVSNYLPTRTVIEESNDTVSVYTDVRPSDAKQITDQYLPCARLEKAHIELMLDPTLPTGTKFSISKSSQPIYVYGVGYTENQKRKIWKIGKLEPEALLDFKIGQEGLRGILVSEIDASLCTNKIIDLNRKIEFELLLKK